MRNVLVTGATRGLGLAIVRRLVADGFRVVATGRAETPDIAELAATSPDGGILFRPLDLARTEEIHGFVTRTIREVGPLYGLVNNAALGSDGVLATMHNSDIERLLRVNTLAPLVLSKYASRSMMLRREGRIVNVSSIIASTGFSGLCAYAASKSALEGFTRSFAREVGRVGITVNAVAPGYMRTEMTSGLQGEKLNAILRRSPMGRLAETGEVAGAVAFLMGPDAAAITGTTLTIDAGSTA